MMFVCVCVCVSSYWQPQPALGEDCRGSADQADQRRMPSVLQQQRSPPRPLPQSRCCDLQRDDSLFFPAICSRFTWLLVMSFISFPSSFSYSQPLHHKQNKPETSSTQQSFWIQLTVLQTLPAQPHVLIILHFNAVLLKFFFSVHKHIADFLFLQFFLNIPAFLQFLRSWLGRLRNCRSLKTKRY